MIILIYDEKNPPIITEDNQSTSKSLLHTVMLDEIYRLRNCICRKERFEIRKFILDCEKTLEKHKRGGEEDDIYAISYTCNSA